MMKDISRFLWLVVLMTPLLLTAQTGSDAWQLYATWGYNRSWHSPTDMTVVTDKGDFTIYDAQGTDRPTDFTIKKYFAPGNITKPQYNYRLGVTKTTDRGLWRFEMGLDHLKWIFNHTAEYTITGNYSGPLYLLTPEGGVEKDLTYFIDNHRADFIKVEYTDGHNYAFLSAGYLYDLYTSASTNFKMSLGGEGAFGLYIPRPFGQFLGADGEYKGDNGEFQISGWGASLGLTSRATFYDRVFIESSLRGIGVTNHSTFYPPVPFETKHKGMMSSLEWYTGVGVVLLKF